MEENFTDSLIKLKYKDKSIIIIPTAHVSTESVELVKKTIDYYKPDSVCIELDKERYKNLKNPDTWKNTNIIDIIKQKKVGLLISNLILSSYQKNIAKKLKTNPGAEMIQGISSAEEINAKIVLSDRNIQTTFMRIWRSLGAFKKLKLIFSLMFTNDNDEITEEDLEKLLKRNNLEDAVAGLSNDFPEISKVLLHERDEYLAYNIKNAPGNNIVAILGAAHTIGVEKEIFKEQNLKELDKIPNPSKVSKVLPWIIPILILCIIIYGFYQSIGTGTQQVKAWFVYNSIFAGIFTLIGLGHPLSVLTAFIAAPFTSLNPFLACGWFAGLVEASIRKPTVDDVNRIPEDIFKIKGIFSNKFLKALLIVILANIGSTIGTIVAGTSIIKNLF